MSKNITTRVTIENLAAELKKKFAATNTRIAAAEAQTALAFKSLKVDGNTISFFTSADKSGTAAATVDFPAEYFLDQAKTALVPKFTWAEATYPGSTNPNLNNKPVLVLAVKGDDGSVSYSFLNMEKLMNVYTAKVEGKDASTTVSIDGYTIDVAVNISAEAGNAIIKKDDGLYVASPKVAGATAGNFAGLAADGSLTDSGKKPGDFVEKVIVDGVEDEVIHVSDIKDYTTEEIAALLADTPAQE